MSARALVAVLIALLVLTGCNAGDDMAGPEPTTSSAAPTPTADESTPDEDASASATATGSPDTEDFVAAVREKLPDVSAGRTEAEITRVAELACQALDAGTTADQLVALVRTLGTLDAEATDEATARELVKLAIDTTCPDQAGRVDEF